MAGIYIHIPFCKQACYYCDFHFSTSLKKKDELLKALHSELILRKGKLKNDPVESIYFGGGTPSLLSITELQILIGIVYANYSVVDNPEITLEANPDDLSIEQINDYSNTRINRLSIGIQSFFDDDLEQMNRAHSAKEARECLKIASTHFDNITIDLIYGIPNMSEKRWEDNLQIAFDHNVPHISSYALTVEPKTALDSFIKKGKYPPINEELALHHFNILMKTSEDNGYVQYEISNFGKPDFFSKHNTSYWQGKSYLGIGPSAHSFNGVERSWNVANNIKYINSLKENKLPLTIETLSDRDRFNEYIMTGLRTIWGVSIHQIKNEFGNEYSDYLLQQSEKFIEQELLKQIDDKIIAEKKGKFLIDGIASDLFLI